MVMRTATAGRGSIAQARPQIAGPRRQLGQAAHLLQRSRAARARVARARTHTHGEGRKFFFLKNERLDSLLSDPGAARGGRGRLRAVGLPPARRPRGMLQRWPRGPRSSCTPGRRQWQSARRGARPPPAPSCWPWLGPCWRPVQPEVSHPHRRLPARPLPATSLQARVSASATATGRVDASGRI